MAASGTLFLEECVRRPALLADRYLAFEDVDELVPREDPLELAGRATPEATGEELVLRLREDRTASRRRSLLNPGGVDRHGWQLGRHVGGGDQRLCHGSVLSCVSGLLGSVIVKACEPSCQPGSAKSAKRGTLAPGASSPPDDLTPGRASDCLI